MTTHSGHSPTQVPLPTFSHIYLESELLNSPWENETSNLLARFPKAELVEVSHYSEVTQRRAVSWNQQKRSPKLVLALKKSELIYPCSDVAPNFGHPNFYYSVPMQNCLYDCEYCYLQGMYTSPHLVYFVNQSELIEKARRTADELGSLYLCIAYDNDLLAVENLLGTATRWVEGLRDCESIKVEIRTKSANFRPLSKLEPAPNFILAWTLSPSSVIERYEAKTPSLKARLASLKQAISAGWKVRLCLDPLLPVKDWHAHYSELIESLDREALWADFQDASYGAFRLPKQFLRQARKARPDSALLAAVQSTEQRGLHTLGGEAQEELLDFVGRSLRSRMGSEKVWRT